MRQRVRRSSWRGEAFWLGAEVLFVSDEDLGRNRKPVARWTSDVPIVALTRDRHGARVHADGRWWKIAAFPSREVDPTGAGDVFAAAFLVRYRETKDVGQSARFASAAAACSIEGGGIEAIADRDQIEGLLAAHPDVVLR
jgi:sugar/nucleoside kinase (ribokinase family)